MLPEGKGWLMAEFGADKKRRRARSGSPGMEWLKANPTRRHEALYRHRDMEHIWEVRESGLGATAFVPGEPDTWEGWEDSAVAPEKLGGYLRELRDSV